MPKTVTKKLGAKKVAAKEVEETIAPEITVPEVKVKEPKKEVFVEKMPVLGKLGLVNVRRITKVVINERELNEVYCEDGTTYLLTDADMDKQFKKV
jgi:hypothetical protein